MAGDACPAPAADLDRTDSAALQHRPWRKLSGLSSGLKALEQFLSQAGFDRAPWLAVCFAGGVLAWLALPGEGQWIALLLLCASIALGALALMRADGNFPYLRLALVSVAVAVAAGAGMVWTKSALVGTPAIERPLATMLDGTVLKREEQPAEGRVRLTLATREPGTGRALRVRLNLPQDKDREGLGEGARVRLRARLMPPAPPMLPGGYDFARAAWFNGLSATGSVLSEPEVLVPALADGWFDGLQKRLSDHVRERLPGNSGAIAATLASGDRGSIAPEDDAAMRDAGLAHLLSISGLHVSAVVAAAYFIAIRLLALWPWLALRVRLPLVAASAGAIAGVGYTLLTGSEVPTVRSCIGAVLVLGALAMGREPLSLRLLSVAALFVMLFWPEAVVGPSFQMSFASVLAIVALHSSAPVRNFIGGGSGGWISSTGRQAAMLLGTGVVIELALMPIGLFHFHRAGVYGALVNVVAIPLTTFVSMPLVALALLLDLVGAGAPAWWLSGKSIDLMLWLAHWTASQPGAVNRLPAMGRASILLFVAGGLWLALWRGRVRLWGLVPIALGALSLLFVRTPDLLVSGDGHSVGITGEAEGRLLVIREGRTSFARDTLTELAGLDSEVTALDQWPAARCSRDYCAITLLRAGREWHLLISRGRERVEERALAAACDRADIVIADHWLPRSCKPAWLKADRRMLERTGGLAIDLGRGEIRTVAESQGDHGWWRKPEPRRPKAPASPAAAAPPVTDGATRVPDQ